MVAGSRSPCGHGLETCLPTAPGTPADPAPARSSAWAPASCGTPTWSGGPALAQAPFYPRAHRAQNPDATCSEDAVPLSPAERIEVEHAQTASQDQQELRGATPTNADAVEPSPSSPEPLPSPPAASRLHRDRQALLGWCVWEDAYGNEYVSDGAGGVRPRASPDEPLPGEATSASGGSVQPSAAGEDETEPDTESACLRRMMPELRNEGPFDWSLSLVGDGDARLGLEPAEAGAGVAVMWAGRSNTAARALAGGGPRAVECELLQAASEEECVLDAVPITADTLLEDACLRFERDMESLCQAAWTPRLVEPILPEGTSASSLGSRLPGTLAGSPSGPALIALPEGAEVTLVPALSAPCIPHLRTGRAKRSSSAAPSPRKPSRFARESSGAFKTASSMLAPPLPDLDGLPLAPLPLPSIGLGTLGALSLEPLGLASAGFEPLASLSLPAGGFEPLPLHPLSLPVHSGMVDRTPIPHSANTLLPAAMPLSGALTLPNHGHMSMPMPLSLPAAEGCVDWQMLPDCGACSGPDAVATEAWEERSPKRPRLSDLCGLDLDLGLRPTSFFTALMA
ncbi:hypothetical protein HYH03_004780 [Edaphochlamys debaryana]|uniref:Uncharacterized protein n=1 Tax=Edaphochlamys debaryana TaxID=47281 RepID=A0A835Y6Z0_9CHLO|nr:hypothetical protein HYH03_004780 [Edaphochlamys debaryana]|eukprot:KAG2497191.1 hypothetical protein HYH03_004780 [Edaphochlamys debaryana]